MFPSKYKDNSENSTGLLFMRVFNKWHSIIKKELKKLDITQPQFVVLTSLAYLLQEEDEVTQIMLSKISGIDVMTISQIINLLEKNGFESEGVRKNAVYKDGKLYDLCLYGKLKQ